ncbi:MAG: orotidine-5'-phosphate decarboxylase [Candidatus Omnitrophota bacterium]|nr:orotidine-5'-phosphate decarboxylase [Candidatus Omnitrophota bacterium]
MQRLSNPEIILALDVDTLEEAKHFVDLLYPKIKLFKIGSQLFTACGPEVVKMVGDKGGKVFLDLKFHDIPNTVYYSIGTGSTICIAPHQVNIGREIKDDIVFPVFMMTVHIKGGRAMLDAAAKGAAEKAKELGIEKPFIVGVTRLTSEKDNVDTLKEVLQAAQLAKDSGLDGVVCSALEAEEVRKVYGEHFIIVTPGIRPDKAVTDDQKRTATVKEAVKAGSNFLVIGRPILKAPDPLLQTEELLGDLYGAGN